VAAPIWVRKLDREECSIDPLARPRRVSSTSTTIGQKDLWSHLVCKPEHISPGKPHWIEAHTQNGKALHLFILIIFLRKNDIRKDRLTLLNHGQRITQLNVHRDGNEVLRAIQIKDEMMKKWDRMSKGKERNYSLRNFRRNNHTFRSTITIDRQHCFTNSWRKRYQQTIIKLSITVKHVFESSK
jgi:hypothetical protein